MTVRPDTHVGLPLPPLEVARRSGSPPGPAEDPYADYVATGEACRSQIDALLPADWRWEDKRVLDFGCGAGRTLRNFAPEAERAQFSGCDIYEEGVRWIGSNLSPPVDAFVSGESPPLPRADGSFDLIYALSVFTHITDAWSEWLVEMRRLLSDGGLLIATFVGAEMTDPYLEGAEREDVIGMNVLLHDNPWESGGPLVLHSDWWLRAHWGRAFEVVAVDSEPAIQRAAPHRWWLFRKRDAEIGAAELERIEPGEDRERIALEFNRRQLQRELERRGERVAAAGRELRLERRRSERRRQQYEGSASWRMTAPLRALGGLRRRSR